MYKKKSLLNLSIGIALSALVSSPVWAGDLKPEVEGVPDSKSRVGGGTHYAPQYQPPVSGAPTRRVGGGTRGVRGVRGVDSVLPTLTALVPESTAHTISNQPSLYWYLSESTQNPVKFTLIYANPLEAGADVKPVLETDIEKPSSGIQAIDLSKYNVELKTDTEYEWSVTLTMGQEQGSSDIITSGTVKRVVQTPDLTKKIDAADEKGKAFVYAESGLWYDALDSLSKSIEKNPTDKTLQEYRASLFEQVGLKNIVQ
jgi:hypothetical protein